MISLEENNYFRQKGIGRIEEELKGSSTPKSTKVELDPKFQTRFQL